jgi:DNA polymerase I-like protein with 3'-5' exonuclease and polymerase domains
MNIYDKEMPFVWELAARCQNLADRRGYIKMFDGARSHFDSWDVGWLSQEERKRGYAEGHRMNACSLEEAQQRQSIPGHPWKGERLKRAFTHKAMNRRIQGGAARQMKLAMAQCADEGFVPMLQMHDKLAFSLPKTIEGKKAGERIAEIMRTVYQCRVPFLVDMEWGDCWGDCKPREEGYWPENRSPDLRGGRRRIDRKGWTYGRG